MTQRELNRFWSKVELIPFHECWEWAAGRNKDGYGYFDLKGSPLRAHRVSWEINFGAVPPGMIVCHRCDNPPCVNPKHLFLGTQLDNMRDRANKKRTNTAGERNGAAKLTRQLIDEILSLKGSGVNQQYVANKYTLSQSAVSRIWSGKRWPNHTNLVEK